MKLGCGATELVPATRIDDKQAAVRVLQYIGGMKVEVARNDKILVPRAAYLAPQQPRPIPDRHTGVARGTSNYRPGGRSDDR